MTIDHHHTNTNAQTDSERTHPLLVPVPPTSTTETQAADAAADAATEADADAAGSVDRTVFPVRHAGIWSGGMDTVSDDIGCYGDIECGSVDRGAGGVGGVG